MLFHFDVDSKSRLLRNPEVPGSNLVPKNRCLHKLFDSFPHVNEMPKNT